MGNIKDVVDLVVALSNKISDRKFAAELRDIQAMLGSLQSEQAQLHESRMALMSQSADLKKETEFLKSRIKQLEEENAKLKNPQPKKFGKKCPYCGEPSLQLVKIEDSPNQSWAILGIRQRYYKCDNCQRDYDEEEK
jgi:ABC-type oligopeptide transport system ATPase subunit